ncbi:hypothetical protein [Krasilnikovia sp. MM14-A1259]|uniref:DUF7718 family protein n=1 Tax=Krasilnikovia sp. MM14-A1259 TaxID=3373539 RepID=UPI00399C5774
MRHSASKAPKPKPATYEPPPADDCTVDVFQTYPTGSDNDGQMLVVRIWVYRALIVDFAINQVIEVDGSWKDVARIDCCGGTVHRHQFDKDGNDLIGHKLIREIPPDAGGEVVNEAYKEALAVMHDEYDDNLRRWRGDDA